MALDLLFDNRTLDRSEIVIQTRNEEVRLRWLCEYFTSHFDLVVLDGGSTDGTESVAREFGATMFRRHPGYAGFEYNHLYMQSAPYDKYFVGWNADEFCDKYELAEKIARCSARNGTVMSRRVDWMYGVRTRPLPNPQPLAMRKDQYVYLPHALHVGFQLLNPESYKEEIVVEHMQVLAAYRYFLGPVVREEIVQPVTEADQPRSTDAAIASLAQTFRQIGQDRFFPRLITALVFLAAKAAVNLYAIVERHLLRTERGQYDIYHEAFIRRQKEGLESRGRGGGLS
jgi:hypothetical protein